MARCGAFDALARSTSPGLAFELSRALGKAFDATHTPLAVSASRWPRFLLIFPVILAGVVALTLGFLMTCYPEVGSPPPREALRTEASLERGRHLVEDIAACTTCHSPRDWTKYGAPMLEDQRGFGGEGFDRKVGLPGVFPAPNLTPSGLSEWSDAEIGHTIQTGVSLSLGSLMPVMPYMSYAGLCSDDVDAIIVYLRSLEPGTRALKSRELDFPLPLLIRTFPQEGDAHPCPQADDPTELHGAYLARTAGCANCHTSTRDGRPLADMGFAGGSVFHLPNGSVSAASNLTMDETTGIGTWSEEQFIGAFRTRAEVRDLVEGEAGTNMPWLAYSGLTDQELASIFAYLKTLPAVPNVINAPKQEPLPTKNP